MALEFARVHVLTRSQGHSVVAAAAYRSGERLTEERSGETFDYRNRNGNVVYSEVLLPAGADVSLSDRATFWNAVETAEEKNHRRDSAQTGKDHIIALPRELGKDHHIRMAQRFAQEYFADRGVPVDVAVHYHSEGNPHAHLLAATRYLDDSGFGKKARDLNGAFKLGRKIPDDKLLKEHWTDFQDRYFQEYGLDLKVSRNAGKYLAQAHLGPAHAMEQKGFRTALGDFNREVSDENLTRIQRDPDLIIRAVADRYAVFSRWDLHRELERRVEDPELYKKLIARVENSKLLVRMPTDLPHGPFYTTQDTLSREEQLSRQANTLNSQAHALPESTVQNLSDRHAYLSADQRHALHHALSGNCIAVIEGVAGSGKSTLLSVAREGWEGAGYRVIGVAPTGKAARGLEAAAGMPSYTLHSLFWQLDKGRNELNQRDVIVADEAAMIDSRMLNRLVTAAVEAKAKLVLIGDSEQLQPVQAGGAYRLLRDQVGHADLTTVRRQHAEWQRQATVELGRGEADKGLAAYWEHGHIQFKPTLADARATLINAYLNDYDVGSSLLLAHRNDDVNALNQTIRTHLKRLGELGGELGTETRFQSVNGPLEIAIGERVLFTRNNKRVGVSNGDLGVVTAIRNGRLTVTFDEPNSRQVTFSAKEYGHVQYGYATTLHKAQSATVDRSYVLATRGMNKHLTYVALTRHRQDVRVVASQDEFKNENDFFRQLTGASRKITAIEFAHRHGHDANDLHTLKSEAELALEWVSANHSVFTLKDIAKALKDTDEVSASIRDIQNSGELVQLPTDQAGGPYYTTRQTLQREAELLQWTGALQENEHSVNRLATVLAEHPQLSDEQRKVVQWITEGSRVAVVEGLAGTGKSTLLNAAREAWEADLTRVFGIAPTGKAARGLEDSAGILSTTVHSFLNRLEQDADALQPGDVVVIDEAGLVDTRLMHSVVDAVTKAQAKVVLVGDSEQLQPVQAGGAYSLIKETTGHIDLTTIRRQVEPWQRQATFELGRGEVRKALMAYHRHGHIHVMENTDAVKERLVQAVVEHGTGRDNGIHAKPGSLLVLAHRNADVDSLNTDIRKKLKQQGTLGPVEVFTTVNGPLEIAQSERVIFRQNHSGLDVQNGILGTVTAVRPGALDVKLDDSARTVTVEQSQYRHLEYGYAMTIHKSQSVTAERVAVLATATLDKHLTYVALSRHRQAVDVYGGKDQFKSGRHFIQTLSRPRKKLSATAFAERQGLNVERLVQQIPAAAATNPIPTTTQTTTPVTEPVAEPAAKPQPATIKVESAATPELTPKRGQANAQQKPPATPDATQSQRPPHSKARHRTPARRRATLAAVKTAIEQGNIQALQGMSFQRLSRRVLNAIHSHAADVTRWPPHPVELRLQMRTAYRDAERAYRIAESNHDSAQIQLNRYVREHPIAAQLAKRGLGQGAFYFQHERERAAEFKTASAAFAEQEQINQSPALQQKAAAQVAREEAQQQVAQAILEQIQPGLERAQLAAEQYAQLHPDLSDELEAGFDD